MYCGLYARYTGTYYQTASHTAVPQLAMMFIGVILYTFLCVILSASGENLDRPCILSELLSSSEFSHFSQNGEDGVLLALLSLIGSTTKTYVEFGVQNGAECNTRILRERLNFTGVMFDSGYENAKTNLHKEWIFAHDVVKEG